MTTIRTMFVQDHLADTAEYKEVVRISDLLLAHLESPPARQLIAQANLPRASSAAVQETFRPFAEELGFTSEARGLFDDYENRAVRPDYYLPVRGSGILLEVERGKTTTNNMDFLDFWKCHLCPYANYLFLMVPKELRHNENMRPKREYENVLKRLGSFFHQRNYTNVRGLHVFGY